MLVFVLAGALATSMLLSGCKKCYTCYTYCVYYTTGNENGNICGSRTVSVRLIDSLISAGDTILNSGWGAITNLNNFEPQQFCGRSQLHDAEASGDSCVEGVIQ